MSPSIRLRAGLPPAPNRNSDLIVVHFTADCSREYANAVKVEWRIGRLRHGIAALAGSVYNQLNAVNSRLNSGDTVSQDYSKRCRNLIAVAQRNRPQIKRVMPESSGTGNRQMFRPLHPVRFDGPAALGIAEGGVEQDTAAIDVEGDRGAIHGCVLERPALQCQSGSKTSP